MTDAAPEGTGSERASYASLFASYQSAEILTMAAELGATAVTAVASGDGICGPAQAVIGSPQPAPRPQGTG